MQNAVLQRDEYSDESDESPSKEEMSEVKKSISEIVPSLRNYNKPQQSDKDENKNGGTLIIEGLNSFIFIPNDEDTRNHLNPSVSTRYPPKPPPVITSKPLLSKPSTRRTTPRTTTRPSRPIGSEQASHSKLKPKCDQGFLAFLGLLPAGCPSSSKNNQQNMWQHSFCPNGKANQPREALPQRKEITPRSNYLKPRESTLYSQPKNTLWDDYDTLELKNKDPLENMWNMENVLNPKVNYKVNENLLRKMYKEYVNNKNSAADTLDEKGKQKIN